MAPKQPPPQPDYVGAALSAGITTPTASNPNDVWGLGDLYGQHVYMGTGPGPVDTSTPEGIAAASQGLNTIPVYGTTQAIMKQVVDLWARQQTEKQSHPHQLTSFEQMQRTLWQAGFYGQTSIDDVHVGQWTPQTQTALTQALTQYEGASNGGKLPITFSEFLSQNAVMGQDGGKNSKSAGATPPAPIGLADPTAIRQAAQSAAMDALGQGLSPDQLDKFVSQFQAAQVSYASTTTGTANSPDLSADAASFAQQSDPRAYKENQRQVYLNSLVNLLGPPVGRPSMSPTPSVGG